MYENVKHKHSTLINNYIQYLYPIIYWYGPITCIKVDG